MTTTEHEVAVFQEADGWNFILVWIDNEDIETFSEEYTLDEWQTSIEAHEFVQSRNLPVVIAFEDENGDPQLYGEQQYVDLITEEFDWDGITWGHTLVLEWDTDDEDEDEDEDDDDEDEDEDDDEDEE